MWRPAQKYCNRWCDLVFVAWLEWLHHHHTHHSDYSRNVDVANQPNELWYSIMWSHIVWLFVRLNVHDHDLDGFLGIYEALLMRGENNYNIFICGSFFGSFDVVCELDLFLMIRTETNFQIQLNYIFSLLLGVVG